MRVRTYRTYHLYLDSSAIVKVYIREEGTGLVRRAVEETWRTYASDLAYPEARSAFARLRREGVLDDERLAEVVGFLNEDWKRASYSPIAAEEEVCRRAGDLAEKHSLRAYDAVQLASALRLRSNFSTGSAGDVVRFLSFDERLSRVAEVEGMLPYEPPVGGDEVDAEEDPGESP